MCNACTQAYPYQSTTPAHAAPRSRTDRSRTHPLPLLVRRRFVLRIPRYVNQSPQPLPVDPTEQVITIYERQEQNQREANEEQQRQAAWQVRQAEEDEFRKQEEDHDAAMTKLDKEITRNEAEEKKAVDSQDYDHAKEIKEEIDRLKALKVSMKQLNALTN